jgi:hypothetical protein
MGNMGFLAWAAENWFDILSSIGIVGSLCFTAVSLRSETKTRKIANLLALTTSHREIWKEFYDRPELSRVLDPSADLHKQSVTLGEEEFVKFVILHLSSAFYAMNDELVMKLEGVRKDACEFFSLPIPRAIWEKLKVYQNDDFVAFVEECRLNQTFESKNHSLS